MNKMSVKYFLQDKNRMRHEVSGIYKIGSGIRNNLVLLDDSVNKHHCTILIGGKECYLYRHKNSKLSVRTKVLKEKKTKLKHYDMITIGRNRLRFIIQEGIKAPSANETNMKLWANDHINSTCRESVIKFASKNGLIDAETQTTITYFEKERPQLEVKMFRATFS